MLGLPPSRTPSAATVHRVFKWLDAVAFEQVVGAWLEDTGVEPVSAFALDGKALRGIHGDGVPIPPRWLIDQDGRITGVFKAEPKVGGGRRELRVLRAISYSGVPRWLGGTGTHRTPWP